MNSDTKAVSMSRAFANLDGLVQLSNRKGIDIRRPLLRVLTDLYMQEATHSREEEQQFIELSLRLLPAVDEQTRVSIARKLAAARGIPRVVLEAFADGVPEIRGIVDEADARAAAPIANDPEPDMEFAIVSSTPDPIGPAHTLGEQFFQATSSERVAMLSSRGKDGAIAGERMTLLLPGKTGASERIEAATLAGNHDELARELRQVLGISNRTAWRIVQDESGESFLVAANALGMPSDVLVRCLLFVSQEIGESVERVFSLTATYETMHATAGADILASWREEHAMHPAKLQSVHAPSQMPGAREAATPARVAATTREQEPARTQRTS